MEGVDTLIKRVNWGVDKWKWVWFFQTCYNRGLLIVGGSMFNTRFFIRKSLFLPEPQFS